MILEDHSVTTLTPMTPHLWNICSLLLLLLLRLMFLNEETRADEPPHFRICCQITRSNNKQGWNVPLPLPPLPLLPLPLVDDVTSVTSALGRAIHRFPSALHSSTHPHASHSVLSRTRAISEQFQSSFRAILEQFLWKLNWISGVLH